MITSQGNAWQAPESNIYLSPGSLRTRWGSVCSLPGSPHPSDVSASLCWAFLQSCFKNSSPPWMQYTDNEWNADFIPWSVDQTALHTHTHTHTHTRILPTTLHPLTFAVFRASRPLCSSLPPFQASAPVPSNLLTHQKAFLFLSACVVFPSSWMCWYLTTLCSEKGDN